MRVRRVPSRVSQSHEYAAGLRVPAILELSRVHRTVSTG